MLKVISKSHSDFGKGKVHNAGCKHCRNTNYLMSYTLDDGMEIDLRFDAENNQLDLRADSTQSFLLDESIDISYCPFCGRKLKTGSSSGADSGGPETCQLTDMPAETVPASAEIEQGNICLEDDCFDYDIKANKYGVITKFVVYCYIPVWFDLSNRFRVHVTPDDSVDLYAVYDAVSDVLYFEYVLNVADDCDTNGYVYHKASVLKGERDTVMAAMEKAGLNFFIRDILEDHYLSML